jgi:hypothetical protein
MAADRLPDPGLGVRPAGSGTAVAGAHKAIGPARFEQVSAARLIWKVQLKLDQGAGKRGYVSLVVACVRSLFLDPTLFIWASDALHHD